MINKSLRKPIVFYLLFFLATTASCDGESPTEDPVLNISEYQARVTAVNDVANNGDASDIQIEFSAGQLRESIQEYRLIMVKNAALADVDLESAKTLDANRYTTVVGGAIVYEEKLSSAQQDFNGGAVEEGESYTLFVLSVGDFNGETVYALSDASEDVEVIIKAETSTLVSGTQANDAVSVDADGNLYVSNYGVWDQSKGQGTGNKILKITPDGQVSEFVTGLLSPVGNSIDQEGNFYVNDDNDFARGNLLKIAPDGTRTTIATIKGYPAGLLIGTDGNFYVSNYNRGVVSKVTPEGTVTEFATDARLSGGVGIVYGNDGNIIVGNFDNGDVLSINPNGEVTLIGKIPVGGQGSVIGYLTFFEGNVYATNGGARKIYKMSLAGEVVEFAGSGENESEDGELASASFSGPNGISVDKNKRVLYVSESIAGGLSNIRVIPIDQ